MTTSLAPLTILDRLAKVVHSRPDHAAVVVCGTDTYSYKQLWQDAIYMASCLKHAGIGKECIVAIALPKSYQYLAAVLGTWMAGAAFVPVDTTMPLERVAHILKESLAFNGGHVIGAFVPTSERSKLQALLPELLLMPLEAPDNYKPLGIGQIIDTNADVDKSCASNLHLESNAFCPAKLAPQDLAYVIFTSGSTGQPKGVLVEHRGLVNLLDEQISAFAIDGNTRSLFYLSTNFDASISDFGTALAAGATLYIEQPADLTPGKALFDLIKARGITYVDIPPSALRLMDPELLPDCLKSIVIGGEVCPRDVVTAFAKKLRLICVYGPTEATVCTSWTHCLSDLWQAPLIGKPINGIKYIVMDAHGKPVDAGTAGELYISGSGLARGYLNNPSLTNERFVTINGERYYLSRDTVVETADGNYEFLGRVDRQLKLRGLLIEPEEIEKHLAEHKQIARAAVLKRSMPDNPERHVLVAFVQASNSEQKRPDSIELREHLTKSLPRWMLPQRYQWIESMPETTSGKVDVKALGQIALTRTINQSRPGAGTQSELAQKLSQAVEQLLGYDHLQDEDNLFDLGLDSLAVIELSATLSSLGVEISPHTIFQNPTIKTLVATISRDSKAQGTDSDHNRDALKANYLRQDVFDSPLFKELETIAASRPKDKQKTSNCLLVTGATGFLGARILQLLLAQPCPDNDRVIYALVRADDDLAAGQRLIAAATASDREQITGAIKQKRLLPLAGDILSPTFGLSTVQYQHLAATVDCIVHLAARVNMVQPYNLLKDDNVAGSLNLARLALTGKSKNMHYASTLSVFVSTDKNTGRAMESDCLDDTETIWGGYGQSKWIAEVALRKLSSQSFNLNTYRLGLITGDTADGTTGSHDFLAMFIRGLRALGCVPQEALTELGSKLALDITPVDWAAGAMAALILHQNGANQTYHLANEEPLSLKRLAQLFIKTDRDLPLLKMSQLQSRQSTFNQEAAAAYLSLCRLYDGNLKQFANHRVMDLFQATDIKFDCQNSKQALSSLTDGKVSHTCPQATDELISLYIRQALR
ncbi:MAG: amino acid adenylation domain-containing protein [Candidatus Obscuribacter sp.]|nr:amino acid adenylation domain-containing protein [Candidatus Obscuribacter sp.]